MRILFVLGGWGIFGAVAAAIAGLVLRGYVASRLHRAGITSEAPLAIASIFPLAVLAFESVLYVLYAGWCVCIRHVDPGLGDWGCVPIAAGYTLQSSDESYYIKSSTGWQSECITSISEQDGYIIAERINPDSLLMLINTRAGAACTFQDEREMLASAAADGSMRVPELRPVERFYFERRWSFGDAIVAALAFLLPIGAGISLLRRLKAYIRAERAMVDGGR